MVPGKCARQDTAAKVTGHQRSARRQIGRGALDRGSVMASQQQVPGELLAYVRAVSLREDDILRELREKTATFPAGSSMQVMAEEGQLLRSEERRVGEEW